MTTKMRNVFILFLLLPQSNLLFSQNLIPNGDFELGPDSSSYGWTHRLDECSPDGSIDGPTYWEATNGSPDLLMEYDIVCDWDVDTANSGDAYVVFVYNEIGKTTLIMPVEKDSTYRLSYYAKWEHFGGLATEPTRVTFSILPDGNEIISPYFSIPHVWIYVETEFIAESDGVEFQIAGTEHITGGIDIDDISLKKIRPIGLDLEHLNGHKSITPYPNPFINEITLTSKNDSESTFLLYAPDGELIDNFVFTGTTTHSPPTNTLGIYYYEIWQEERVISRGKVIKID